MASELNILIDFDNLPDLYRSRNLRSLAENILSKVTPSEIDSLKRIKIRLYGGWYEKLDLTINAQSLSAQISNFFPITWNDPLSTTSYIISMEMAYTILPAPRIIMYDTFRSHHPLEGIKCLKPSEIGCKSSTCSINQVVKFINTGKMDGQCCDISPKDLFRKRSQKLVDTMLSLDLVHLATQYQQPIIIVSSDDDFWPSIITALKLGRRVIQVHTKPHYKTASHYSDYATAQYLQKNIGV